MEMEQKHASLGIASFVISILCGISMFALFGIAGIMEATSPGGIDEESIEASLLGLLLMALLFFHLLSIALGVAAMFQKQKKKLLAILGASFSTLVILITLFLMGLGLLMDS
ncbi:hypothetical protein CO614_06265 [Lysobacteraceae bacterium NML120232]|nr:hypothetical protein CO614_06265 [Xanthomonadaceae bacterium NML120232]